jgi:hypothetical protein
MGAGNVGAGNVPASLACLALENAKTFCLELLLDYRGAAQEADTCRFCWHSIL